MRTTRIQSAVLSAILAVSLSPVMARGDEGIFDDGAATATGDILESQGDLAEGLGRNTFLRSLSAVQLQKALGIALENREESVEMYYELRDLREAELADKTAKGVAAYKRTLERSQHDRLTESQINRETGELYWPRPLNDQALKPFRKPIEESLAKRSSPGEEYNRFDYLRVARMLDLINRAVESIKDQLDTREVVALKDYLAQIDYDARFNAADERVDY